MSDNRNTTTTCGYGLTAFAAALLSWCLNHSIVYMFLHFLCGFFYLLYAAIVRTDEVEAVLRGIG